MKPQLSALKCSRTSVPVNESRELYAAFARMRFHLKTQIFIDAFSPPVFVVYTERETGAF